MNAQLVKKPCSLQVKHGTFLFRSETFIYNHLRHLTEYPPVVVAQELANAEEFPIEPVEILEREATARVLRSQALRLKKRYVPAVMHAHFGPSGVYALGLKKMLGLPLITSFHGWDISAALNDPHWRSAYDELFREGELFTGTSEYMRQQLLDAGCPAGKIRVVHVGIDLDRFEFRVRRGSAGKGGRYLTVGRLVEKKGMDDAIRAFSLVHAADPSSTLSIIGDGPLRGELEHLAGELGVAGAVAFRGECLYDEVISEMQHCDIFVLASKTAANGDQEGTTMVTKEALASGVPVVATRHAGIPEVVLDGECGYLVQEGDAEALAARMRELAADPGLASRMAATGRAHVEKHFNIVHETEKMESIYREAIDGYQRPASPWWAFWRGRNRG